ncbi:hypothetical protein BDB00DRAFT_794134 [Zychaea mexicana]|uniref:uncharacterized protein n=1 Tax=Zychaea mexicana TaxID=64656 RepID=UPI0022FE2956|nr:uncharacterized protein BDB00DRAFT_794134 [Zychaea mexicana]KAI9499478.1 hypothetical protein BDB00DRAFT_794134 [Zychaea mexicana]
MFLAGKTKEFYIDLQTNRYYKPGEAIKGDVVLDLAKARKIHHIRVTLAGVVQVGANTLTLFSRECQIATAPDESGSAHQLEAKSNRFPFELSIPGSSAELPTSMKLTQQSGVRYTITAVLKIPYTLVQSWSPQDSREISLVEDIDVSLPEYKVKARADEQVKHQENTAVVSMHIPKTAIVRGDILPVTAIIKHYKDFVKPKAVKLSLVRRFYLFGKGKKQLVEQRTIKSRVYDLELTSDNEYKNEFVAKIFIPQSVAPTTSSSGRILRVDYTAHISVDLNTVDREDPRYLESHAVYMDIFVKIGTTPKAEVSIDSDEESDEEEPAEDELPELSKDMEQLDLSDEREDGHEISSVYAPAPVYASPPLSYVSRENSMTRTTNAKELEPASASLSRNSSVASSNTTSSSIRSDPPTAALSRDNSVASTASRRSIAAAAPVAEQPPAPLSRDNSLASTASRRSIAEVHDPLSRNSSFASTASSSRRPAQDNYHTRSSSQHSSSYYQQQHQTTTPQLQHHQLHRDESLHSTISHSSTPSTSPYNSPSTSTSASRNNSVRMSMPVAMPVPPSQQQFPRQQSPSGMAMPIPMPMPHVLQQPTYPHHHQPPPPQQYSTSPHNQLYSSSPHNYHHQPPPPTTYFPGQEPPPPQFDAPLPPPPPSPFSNGSSPNLQMPMPLMPGPGPQHWPSQSSFHSPHISHDNAPPPTPQHPSPGYW